MSVYCLDKGNINFFILFFGGDDPMKPMKAKMLLKIIAVFALLAALFAVDNSFAAVSAIKLSEITKNVNSTVSQLSRILTDVALIAGIAFILASFFKFHQHKLNPPQVPISQGATLLLIGAALTLFVVMLPTAKTAVFGSTAQMSKIGGSDMDQLIGGGSST